MKYITSSEFKKLAKTKGSVSGLGVQKLYTPPVEVVGERLIKFTISTAGIDRDFDSIRQDGWNLTGYKANPVVLWGHDSSSLPIGRCVELAIENGELKATVEFLPADMPVRGEMAEAVLRMCKAGFLSATSVGFLIEEFEFAKEEDRITPNRAGMDIIKAELTEFSIVSVPCNPEAIIEPGQHVEPVAKDEEEVAEEKGEGEPTNYSGGDPDIDTNPPEKSIAGINTDIDMSLIYRKRVLELMEITCSDVAPKTRP